MKEGEKREGTGLKRVTEERQDRSKERGRETKLWVEGEKKDRTGLKRESEERQHGGLKEGEKRERTGLKSGTEERQDGSKERD